MASHRRSARVTVLTAAAATAAAAFGAVPAHADPDAAAPHTTRSPRATVDRLYEEAEKATEDYNRAGERADRLRRTVSRAQDRLARDQERVNLMRGALGAVAGAQYRSGGLDPALALLLSANPDSYLQRASVLDRVGARQRTALGELRGRLRRMAQERAEAGQALDELVHSRAEAARHKRLVEHKLAEARRVLGALSAADRAGYDRSSRSGRDAFGDLLPPLGDLGSSRAAAAVVAARGAIGRPYVWGATGPSSFDCSGLMVWSFRQAGISLPRTAAAQRAAGRRIPLSQAQPGDLVTYRGDASHVAVYAGNGQVIHAPHPGARVRYDPVTMMSPVVVTRV
ncbi:NPL/P60-family secreted protein [Streptomyces laurentii]|uniref:NPL/P60-family secreted protein n=1 Tax=Streptomyces laurentii TaxID=39478 RepID=A0A160NVI9_STRLU|nr:NPL/P60-family secreted protein [Streptomyces laurentii]